MIAILMKKTKEHLTARVAPVVKAIIHAEVVARGMKADADFLELAVLQAANSMAAMIAAVS